LKTNMLKMLHENHRAKNPKTYRLSFLPVFSMLCVFLYFTPWLFTTNMTTLGLYCLGFVWLFFVSWGFVIHMIINIIRFIKRNTFDKSNLISIIIMIICSIVVFIAFSNSFYMTV
jgi:hypothetical protein